MSYPPECPTPEYHETHFYCPSCDWSSDDAPVSNVVPKPLFDTISASAQHFEDEADRFASLLREWCDVWVHDPEAVRELTTRTRAAIDYP